MRPPYYQKGFTMTPAKKAVPSLAELDKKDDDKVVQEKVPEMEQHQTDLISDGINTDSDLDSNEEPEFDRDEDYDDNDDVFLSPHVVSATPNKTPAELASETPDEAAARYGINTTITDEDAENPRVQVYEDTVVAQIPSGTHLHPDIAKDLYNRGISRVGTDNAQVSRTLNAGYDFAPNAELNDKFQKPVEDEDDGTR